MCPARSAPALLLIVAITSPSFAAEWKPAQGPLATKWAKDVSPDKVLPEYPRPQMVRKDWQNLNGLWQLAFAKEGEEAPVGKDLGDQILVPFPVESALSGVMKHSDRLWYRRTFSVPKDWAGKRLLLHFGAVDWEATVWVNGKKQGVHRGGYDPFSFDVTDALKDKGDQELIVGVFDPTDKGTQPRGKQVLKPEGIYYTPTTGIWQTVWLEPVPKASIEALKIVPDVEGGKVRITVQGRGTGDKDRVEVSLMARELGAVRVLEEGAIHGPAQPGVEAVATAKGPLGKPIELTIRKENQELWSPESPFLYGIRIDLYQDGDKGVDTISSYCALRKIEVGKDDKGVIRILLNGKPYFQVGPLDQGFWPDGLYTAPTDAALKYDIEITKKLGFNMCRKHVKVEPARWYYWCDKLGLLVWQDMPSGDKGIRDVDPDLKRNMESAKQFEEELKAMLDHLHNHPCIVQWVVFNEGWGQFDTARLTEWTKKYDPTRLVDCASGWTDRAVGDVHDVHVYPGPGVPKLEMKRAAVLGEFGGLGLGVDGHTWSKKTWGYRGAASQEDLTRKYEQLLRKVYQLEIESGLCAAVYTQTTDVETEANGLMTYDRDLIKVDVDRVAAANRGDFSKAAELIEIVPTSREKAELWRYTLDKPGDDWFKEDFKDAAWKEGKGGFGTKGTPGAVIGTEWKTDDIWIRRECTLPEDALADLQLLVHHDEDVEVYLNGVLAFKAPGYITDYEEAPIAKDARAALKAGKNVIAVHCKQTTGGQYIDVGLVQVKKPKK
jgi:beta-galactosidase/beta-glucuronidase